MTNADKNNKITKVKHKNIENQRNYFIGTWKKIKIHPTKTFIVVIVQENHFQMIQITLDNNHLIIQIIEDDYQIKEIHKTDIVDQTVEIVNIEITIHDQTQTDLNFRLMPVAFQILGIEIIQIVDLETLHTIEIEMIPMKGIETIQMIEILDIKIIDHLIILSTDQTITDQNLTTIKIDHAIIHGTEIQVRTIDKETSLSHHIRLTHVIKIHKKFIGVVHLNFKGK